MASQDDLTLLKQMYQRGEISDEQYDVLRRHVLWGTPLPNLVDELPTASPPASGPARPALPAPAGPRPGPPPSRSQRAGAPLSGAAPGSRGPGSAAAGSPVLPAPRTAAPPSAPRAVTGARYAPDDPLTAPWRPDTGFVPDRWDRPAPSGPYRARTAHDPALPARGSIPDPDRPAPSGRRRARTAHDPALPAGGRVPDRSDGPASPAPRTRTAYDRGLPASRQNVPVRDRDPDGPGYLSSPLAGDDPAPDRDRGKPAPSRRRPDPARTGGGADADRPRRRRQRGIAAVLTSLLLALSLAAAGVWWFALRETGVDPPTYARSVCGSVRDWQQRVDARSSALVKAIPREEDRSKVRSAVETYYRDLATLTDSLRGEVVEAGAVDVPGGRAYADSLAAAVSDQAGTMRDLAARASRLDVKAGSLFETSVRALLTGGENAVSEITAALGRPAAGTPVQLRLALSDEPACAPYVG